MQNLNKGLIVGSKNIIREVPSAAQVMDKDFNSVTKKDFGMKHDFHYITGRRFLDKYVGYQVAYQQHYGVLPEFDQIHCPFTAAGEDVYEFYRLMFVRGFYGAWFYHDLHGRLNKKFKKIYYQYRKEFSFVSGFASNVIKVIEERTQNGDQECIENNLGYKVENGIYYEGTWENNRLVYGLILDIQKDLYFIGSIEYGNNDCGILYRGIQIFSSGQGKEKLGCLNCGSLFMNADKDLAPFEGEALTITMSDTNFSLEICQYEEGYENGKAYKKSTDQGEIKIAGAVMKDGGIKRDLLNPLSVLVHLYCGFCFMTMYYMIKFTYGLLIFPFYRIYRRKHWK